ncbi:MAG: DUF2252 family protein [Acidobacteriaceae bacterium]|nr:DUF2252 family protein [Acidobacteriaceae bacterium]
MTGDGQVELEVKIRSAVDQILAYNRHFPRRQLNGKLEKLSTSPFTLFRTTVHLFARDLTSGWFRDWPLADAEGPIIGDLHTENFGAFRAVTGEIVYDINDFDETTRGSYEIDLRRLMISILLAALDNGHSFGTGVREAELAARSYIDTLRRVVRIRDRGTFAKSEATEVLRLLHKAREKSRAEFIKTLAVEAEPGRFAFRFNERMTAVSHRVQEKIKEAIPGFLAHVLAPPRARPMEYRLQDIAFRFAGAGSLGRARYALLFGKGFKKQEDWTTLRLIEWKDSLNSALDSQTPQFHKDRGQQVFMYTRAFQLFPKRYLGYAIMGEKPMQSKEIGANTRASIQRPCRTRNTSKKRPRFLEKSRRERTC